MKLLRYIITIVCLLPVGSALGQNPNWSVNENAYEHTMTLTSFITLNGVNLENSNDVIAAFVGSEVRGVANPIIDEFGGSGKVAIMTIFSNTSGETLTFRAYDSSNNAVVDLSQTMTFEIDGNVGTRFQAFSLANPALNTNADIVDFAFDAVTVKSLDIQNGIVNVEINDTEDIQQLMPTFTLSDGAQLFNLRNELQNSGEQTLDFSSEVNYQVRSEDRSVLMDWIIRVTQTPLQTARFFRKNAVCHLNGQIMVEFSIEDSQVTLSADNFDSRIQPIFEGKTLFEDVPAGTYTVVVGDFTKEITIEQN